MLEGLTLLEQEIDNTLNEPAPDSQRKLFNHYCSLSSDASRERFVLVLITRSIMLKKQLRVAKKDPVQS